MTTLARQRMSSVFSKSSADHRDLHSFPTRRSSDLRRALEPAQEIERVPDGRVVGLPKPGPQRRELRGNMRSEEHTSELQSHSDLVCRLLLEKKNARTHRLSSQRRRFDGR